jgi:hypothetical protein
MLNDPGLDLAQYISGGCLTANHPSSLSATRHCTQTISRPRPNTTQLSDYSTADSDPGNSDCARLQSQCSSTPIDERRCFT